MNAPITAMHRLMSGLAPVALSLGALVLNTAEAAPPAKMSNGMLVDASGMTLYTFDKDVQGSASNCYDEGDSKCATNWPPLFADAAATPEGDFTIIDRKDGTKIWAYKGWPLYLWIKDTKPGETTGDGVGGVWHTAIE